MEKDALRTEREAPALEALGSKVELHAAPMSQSRAASHLVVNNDVRDAHLAAQSGQPHNQLDGVNVTSDHNQLGLQCVRKCRRWRNSRRYRRCSEVFVRVAWALSAIRPNARIRALISYLVLSF